MRRHKRAVERDTLLVKATVGYAQKLEDTTTLHDRRVTTGRGVLPREPDFQINKGSSWWKNSTKGRDQEGRLVQLRLTAVDSRRNRIFSSEDFLTASQVAGFSSRLASKKTLSGEGDHVEALVGTADFVLSVV